MKAALTSRATALHPALSPLPPPYLFSLSQPEAICSFWFPIGPNPYCPSDTRHLSPCAGVVYASSLLPRMDSSLTARVILGSPGGPIMWQSVPEAVRELTAWKSQLGGGDGRPWPLSGPLPTTLPSLAIPENITFLASLFFMSLSGPHSLLFRLFLFLSTILSSFFHSFTASLPPSVVPSPLSQQLLYSCSRQKERDTHSTMLYFVWMPNGADSLSEGGNVGIELREIAGWFCLSLSCDTWHWNWTPLSEMLNRRAFCVSTRRRFFFVAVLFFICAAHKNLTFYEQSLMRSWSLGLDGCEQTLPPFGSAFRALNN